MVPVFQCRCPLLNRLQQKLRNDQRVTWLPGRPRRLMGIFSCYGWGPGCSDGSFTFRRRPSVGSDQQSKMSGQEGQSVRGPTVPESQRPSKVRVHQTASRFHPFFAHTSSLCRWFFHRETHAKANIQLNCAWSTF